MQPIQPTSPRAAPRLAATRLAAALLAGLALASAPLQAQKKPAPRRAHAAAPADTVPTVIPKRGLVITRSVRIAPGTFRLPVPPDSALLTIRGDDITVDFAGATLEGIPPATDPDRAAGIAVRIDGGTNVRVEHAVIRGYEVGILARGTRGLALVANDLSYNWKPRLFSGIEHESLVDWLSHHHNEKDEWLRFGAAAYLEDVRGGELRGNRIEQGMEGLMLTRCDSVRIVGNTIAFNSGVGIGLYRSSGNVITGNHVDFNVRGTSPGFYLRGQDSADLLLYEQSSGNVVAFNSVTHGGDGLFLWAGQSTMDTGAGGANDNLFYRNDFSYAPTNAMEATFARNTFLENRADGSTYGLWGGYSYGSWIVRNHFGGDRTGVAIEHGQENVIAGNTFEDDSTAINLWANPVERSDWGYPKHHDTRSRDYRIYDDTLRRVRVGLRVANTNGVRFARIEAGDVDTLVAGDTAGVAATDSAVALPDLTLPEPDSAGLDPGKDPLARLPRSAILVDAWGPYDFRSPKLWPVGGPHAVPLPLRVLGPRGLWRVVEQRGVASLSDTTGTTGDTVVVTPAEGSEGDWALTLEYRGAAVVSPRGRTWRKGEPVRFGYQEFEPVLPWDVRFFAWSDHTDPRTHPKEFQALIEGKPAVEVRAPRLDYLWYRPTVEGVPQSKFAVLARSTVTLGPGFYTLRAISDDAVRVWIDGKLAINDWAPHEARVDHAPIGPGEHRLRVEYYQVEGWTDLEVVVVRGVERSRGSPGPH